MLIVFLTPEGRLVSSPTASRADHQPAEAVGPGLRKMHGAPTDLDQRVEVPEQLVKLQVQGRGQRSVARAKVVSDGTKGVPSLM